MRLTFASYPSDSDTYNISVDYNIIYRARYNKKTDEKSLFNTHDQLIAIGSKYFSKSLQLIPDYLIELLHPEKKYSIIRKDSIFFGTYSFEFDGSTFTIIPHFGTKYSIFEQTEQIASFSTYDTERNSPHMVLLTNNRLPNEFSILLCLFLFSKFGSEMRSDQPTFNFRIQKRKFNKAWRP